MSATDLRTPDTGSTPDTRTPDVPVHGAVAGERVPDRRPGRGAQGGRVLLDQRGSGVGRAPGARRRAGLHLLAAELSGFPTAIGHLQTDHRDNGRGLCAGCGRPGYGTPHLPHPCVLRWLADQAAALRARALDNIAAQAAGVRVLPRTDTEPAPGCVQAEVVFWDGQVVRDELALATDTGPPHPARDGARGGAR